MDKKHNIIQNYKMIKDKIYGDICLSDLACKIIDTCEFQRLRDLHQLATANYVYPSATHTRFEHSIGTYHITGVFINSLIKNSSKKDLLYPLYQIKELKNYSDFDTRLIELVKIAGLCHDLGHGAFSHLFDDVLLKDSEHENKYHEIRSIILLKKIIKEYKIDIEDNEINFIGNLINPTDNKGYIYQIISNKINSIDTDKFDYIIRDSESVNVGASVSIQRIINNAKVIDNNICYSKKVAIDLYDLFKTRYELHKKVYNNKTIISTQLMIKDIIQMMDSELKISNSIDDMNKFIKYTDTSILGYLNFINNNEVKNIYKNFRERKIYKLIKLFVLSNDDKNMELKVNEIINSLDEKTKSTIEIYSVKLGFISGNGTNPLDNILLYQNNDQILKYDKNYVSKLIPNSYQEKNIFIFSKDRNIETIKMILGKIDENKI